MEQHRSDRGGWLRAAVLGSNDGIVSTASLMIGITATNATRASILMAGLAGLVAGAMSMAAGEYVSVASQRDAERADIAKEVQELANDPEIELTELTNIYRSRGLDADLARNVAQQLTEHDALGAHLREELGIREGSLANPLQAAATSATAFAAGAILPILVVFVAPASVRIAAIAVVTLIALALVGALGGLVGGAHAAKASLRVVVGSAVAMAISAAAGSLLGDAF